MTHWMITYNQQEFDIYNCLKDLGTTDWPQQKNKFQVGDIVYMYCSRPVMRITHKMRITKINVSQQEHKDETPYLSPSYIDNGAPYIRLELISDKKSYKLNRNELINHGMNQYSGRGRQKIDGELLDYIESIFNK